MVKSTVNLLATNKNFKNGVLTGMMLAKHISKQKKMKGGSSVDFKKALALAAGPLGWLWLAGNKNQEMKDLKKRLEKYEPTPKEVEFDIDDFPVDEPGGEGEEYDFEIEDFE